MGLCGQGANLEKHLWTIALAAIYSFIFTCFMTLAFDRALEVAQVLGRIDKGADKFLLAEGELCNRVLLPFEAVSCSVEAKLQWE